VLSEAVEEGKTRDEAQILLAAAQQRFPEWWPFLIDEFWNDYGEPRRNRTSPRNRLSLVCGLDCSKVAFC
jgi:hypothetical protein